MRSDSPLTTSTTRDAAADLLPASSRSVYHAPSRYIAHSPLCAGAAGPGSTGNFVRSAASSVAGVWPARSFTTR